MVDLSQQILTSLTRHACPWLDGGPGHDGGAHQRPQTETDGVFITRSQTERNRDSLELEIRSKAATRG